MEKYRDGLHFKHHRFFSVKIGDIQLQIDAPIHDPPSRQERIRSSLGPASKDPPSRSSRILSSLGHGADNILTPIFAVLRFI